MKFKNIIGGLVLVCIFVQGSFAQETKDTVRRSHIGINYQPLATYRYLKSDNSDASNVLKQTLDSIETFKYGYSVGLKYGFDLSKMFNLNIGVSYMNLGEQTLNGTIDKFTNYKTSFYYVSIPLGLNANVIRKEKWNFHVGVAAAVNILLKQKQDFSSTLNSKITSLTTHYDLAKTNLIGRFNSGFDFYLSKKSVFTIDVVYLQSLQSISKEGTLKKLAMGVGPSFEYKFRF